MVEFEFDTRIKNDTAVVFLDHVNRVAVLQLHGGTDGRMYTYMHSAPITEAELIDFSFDFVPAGGWFVYVSCCYPKRVNANFERGLMVYPGMEQVDDIQQMYVGTKRGTVKVYTETEVRAHIREVDAKRKARLHS